MKYIIALIFLVFIISCKKEGIKKISPRDDVTKLASEAYEERKIGTKGEKNSAAHISKRFKAIGLEPKGTDGFFQTFSFKPKTDPHREVLIDTKDTDSIIPITNVLGYINNNAKNTVFIGANYDHLGYGGEGSLYREKDKVIHNGADDASGVAVLLNLAVKLRKVNTNNNYLFIAYSGEEMGLLGSNYFVKNPSIDIESVNYMINLDIVGRLKADSTLTIYGTGTSPLFKQVLHAANKNFNLIINESGVGSSNHASFYFDDIPVLQFFTGQHENYHKPSDDTDELNYDGMELISDVIFDVITQLDNDGKLAFRKTKNESE